MSSYQLRVQSSHWCLMTSFALSPAHRSKSHVVSCSPSKTLMCECLSVCTLQHLLSNVATPLQYGGHMPAALVDGATPFATASAPRISTLPHQCPQPPSHLVQPPQPQQGCMVLLHADVRAVVWCCCMRCDVVACWGCLFGR